jgi:hypothetical protein
MNMGVEVKGGERAIRTYLRWGCIIVMAAYLWTTWSNMVTHRSRRGQRRHRWRPGRRYGDRRVGRMIVALILAWVFLTATVVYN